METEYSKEEEMEKLLEDLKKSNVRKEDWEFHDNLQPVYSTGAGLNRKIVEEISEIKKEPEWMRRFRLKALEIFCFHLNSPHAVFFIQSYPSCQDRSMTVFQAGREKDSRSCR